jgi:16S rRNA processing protein RimM
MKQSKNPSTTRHQSTTAPASQVYYHRNQAVTIPDGYIAIGRITTVHGIRGEVRVELHTDFPDRFEADIVIYVGEALTEFTIEVARPHKEQMLVKLDGVDTRNEAELLRGQWIFIPEEEAVPLEADTYWVHDIIGLHVQTEDGEALGIVDDVLFTGANEVYVIKSIGDGPELLLPATDEVVRSVDLDAHHIIVRLLPGMRDE